VGRIGKGRRQVALVSDEELLRTISDDLRSFYADIIQQPLPAKIEAALARIDRAQQGSNLRLPAAHWAGTSLGV
jgi:malonyl CoA-acyl carrier protein transacylase